MMIFTLVAPLLAASDALAGIVAGLVGLIVAALLRVERKVLRCSECSAATIDAA